MIDFRSAKTVDQIGAVRRVSGLSCFWTTSRTYSEPGILRIHPAIFSTKKPIPGGADSIHILSVYYEKAAAHPGRSRREHIVAAMVDMWRPVTLTTRSGQFEDRNRAVLGIEVSF